MTTPAPTNPWQQQEQAEHRAATDPTYNTLLQALRTIARADPTLTPAVAIMALGDLAGDLAISSGAVWTSPDLVDSMQKLTDTLARHRDAGMPASAKAHASVEGWFAAARAPITH
jgi:hypothetical protein